MRFNRYVVSRFAALALALAFAGTGCGNNEVGGEPLDSGAVCYQQDGQIYAQSDSQSQLCGTVRNSGCTPVGGCISFAGDKSGGKFATQTGDLELDGSIDSNMDCIGDCAPSFMMWCGDAKFKGKPYDNRWACVPQLIDGVCHMKATKFSCDDDESCELVGTYPEYGHCISCQADAECDDKNGCTVDSCDSESGKCAHENLAKGASCDDGKKCNGTETCDAGACKAGKNPNCDDGNLCTDDSCNDATGCVHAANTVACDDGNKCTEGDACSAGSCAPGPNPDCSDGNPCTVDTCDAVKGCQHANVADTMACNDGLACTTADECQSGECKGAPKSCSDGNPCTADSCKPADGSCVNAAVADGTVCSEGKQCVAGQCEQNVDVCSVDGMTSCKQAGGVLGYYECVVKPGQQKGTWQILAACGEIGKAVCLEGEGCKLGGAEANCADGLDNDADGKVDCADTDCAATEVCLKCAEDADCDDTDPCTTDTCLADGSCQHSAVAGCCTAASQCDDTDPCTTDTCAADAKCAHAAKCPAGQSCHPVSGECSAPCIGNCLAKQCGDDGCGGSCGTCAAGKTCNSAGACVEPPPPPECGPTKPCPDGFYCAGDKCAAFVDQHGQTTLGASGAGGGPNPDGTPDSWDDDGDGYCEVAPCLGSRNPELPVSALLGGDCDDNPDDDEGTAFKKSTTKGDFMTDGSFGNHPGAKEFADNFDNDCDGTAP